MTPLVPVVRQQQIRAWPKHENGGRTRYLSLAAALSSSFSTDAHTAAYSVPSIERRLDSNAPDRIPVPMVLAIFDIDAEMSHRATGGNAAMPASDEWWLSELEKISRLHAAHPGLFIYRTRGGYRIVGRLPEPFTLTGKADAERWTAQYLEWCAYLRRSFEIVADPCADWTRLFRLPHATRDDNARPERRETIGNPASVGAWVCEPTAEDRAAALLLAKRKPGKKRRKRKAKTGEPVTPCTGPGVLHHLLQARNWLGTEIETGKWTVQCPLESEHSKGVTHDTSTVLLAPQEADEYYGLLHCSHSNSGHDRLTLRDWLSHFTDDEIAAAKKAAGVPETQKAKMTDSDRPEIQCTAELHETIEQSIAALARMNVFQRQGTLVDVVRDATTDDEGIVRPDGTPRIRMLPQPRLREVLSQAAKFMVWSRKQEELVEIAPPPDIAAAIAARGEWGHLRPLSGVASYPVLRALDGSILATKGYDARTQLIYESSIELPKIPDRPTLEDAKASIAMLLDVIEDFPFETQAQRSAFLAALLTLLARPAIDGPVPMVIAEAPEKGVGKTLLFDVLGMITLGRRLPRRTAPEDQAEWKKAMLAIAIAADPIVLIDNVTRMLKSEALDTVLTGTSYRDRVLGKNEELSLDFRTLFVATANNAILSGDLVRRSLHIRLDPKVENPEKRTGWKYPDLLGHVQKHRAALLAAGLTVLRAYCVEGRPAQKLIAMGSYEAWSGLVRGALVWAGQPDPAITQDALRESSDPEREALAALFDAWNTAIGRDAVTVDDVLERAGDGDARPLRDALSVMCDAPPGQLPSARQVGNRLRASRDRIVNGLILERYKGSGRDARKWTLRSCTSGTSGTSDSHSKSSGCNQDIPVTPTGQRPGSDARDVRDVPNAVTPDNHNGPPDAQRHSRKLPLSKRTALIEKV